MNINEYLDFIYATNKEMKLKDLEKTLMAIFNLDRKEAIAAIVGYCK